MQCPLCKANEGIRMSSSVHLSDRDEPEIIQCTCATCGNGWIVHQTQDPELYAACDNYRKQMREAVKQRGDAINEARSLKRRLSPEYREVLPGTKPEGQQEEPQTEE